MKTKVQDRAIIYKDNQVKYRGLKLSDRGGYIYFIYKGEEYYCHNVGYAMRMIDRLLDGNNYG